MNEIGDAIAKDNNVCAERFSVCALLTCFNRRDLTMQCLSALSASVGIENVVLNAILIDDASTDGTANAVAAAFPWVNVIRSEGSLFWCRGMHVAFTAAMKQGFDYYLWLNDDTMLLPNAVLRLLTTEKQLVKQSGKRVIVVGSTVDAKSGVITYGGKIQPSKLKRTTFEYLQPSDQPQRCQTMAGNIVLIPSATAEIVGNLDPTFEHAMGDTDYALRALQSNVELWVAPGVFGYCGENTQEGTYLDHQIPLNQRWKLMMGRKGLPWRSWLVFTRRHTGLLWPIYFAWPYLKIVVTSFARPVSKRAT